MRIPRALRQFGFRTFLLAVAIFAIWTFRAVDHAKKVDSAKRVIYQLGGKVYYDYYPDFYLVGSTIRRRPTYDRSNLGDDLATHPATTQNDQSLLELRSPCPDWLKKMAGVQLFVDIEDVSLGFQRVKDEHVKVLGKLRAIKYLNLTQTDVTDAGLEHLKECRHLEVLHLSGTEIRGPGLVHLSKLRNLRKLWLGRLPIEDSAFQKLGPFPSLEYINLINTHLSAEAIASFKEKHPSCYVEH